MQATNEPDDRRAGGYGSVDAGESWNDKRLLVVAADRSALPPTLPGIAVLAHLDWGSSRLTEAAERADLAFADTRGLADADLSPQLDRLATALSGKLPRLVIVFARDQLDLVAEAFLGRGPDLQCDADTVAVAAALGVAAAMRDGTHAWNEPREEAERIRRLSGEVARLASLLVELTATESSSSNGSFVNAPQRNWGAAPGNQPASPPVTPEEIRAVVRARRLRDQLFGEGLFEDPAWDMLLDLYAARLEGRRVSVSSLCIAAAVAPTTALRWINRLTEAGLFERQPDAQDRRRAFMALTPLGQEAMTNYLAAVKRAGLPIA